MTEILTNTYYLTTQQGSRIFVEECGTGPPIILIHSLGGTTNTFEPLVVSLSSKYKLIRYDLPGFGLSTYCAESSLSIPQFVKDLSLIIEQTAGTGLPILVGHSLGSTIAMHYASVSPVKALVLLGPSRSASHVPEVVERITMLGEVARSRIGEIRDKLVNHNVAPTSSDLVRTVVRQMLTSSNMDGYAATCNAICAKSHIDPDYASINCPTLLIAGDQDVISPINQSKELKALIHNSTVAVVHAAHYHTLEDTEGVLNAMEPLLLAL